MAQKRFRVIIKVLCNNCESLRINRKPFNTNCKDCKYLKYNNVTNLLSFTKFLHNSFPNWIWFNVFTYVKGGDGDKVASFQKDKNEPVNRTI